MNSLSEGLAKQIADRFNEIGLRQNSQTLFLLSTMMGIAIKTKGTLVIRMTKNRTYFEASVIPRRKK